MASYINKKNDVPAKHLKGSTRRIIKKCIYEAQNSNTVIVDWVSLVTRYFNNVGMNLDEPKIQGSSTAEYKKKVKHAVKKMYVKK